MKRSYSDALTISARDSSITCGANKSVSAKKAKPSPKKIISFKKEDEIIFIPPISEYKSYGIQGDIWTSRAELQKMESSAFYDLVAFMVVHNYTDAKEALRIMSDIEDEDDHDHTDYDTGVDAVIRARELGEEEEDYEESSSEKRKEKVEDEDKKNTITYKNFDFSVLL